jgi:hypothetical protein
MLRVGIVLLAAMLSLTAFSSQAFAHAHRLLLNGEVIAILPEEPAVIHDGDPTGGAVEGAQDVACNTVLHPMHNLVHRGTPGSLAFEQENNPISIVVDTPFVCPAP